MAVAAVWVSPKTISIHAPREGSDVLLQPHRLGEGISIHAPREGSDWTFVSYFMGIGISIHAPREGSDCVLEYLHKAGENFNPRSP